MNPDTESDTEVVVHRLAAFTDDPAGGNPAGVVVTDVPLPADTMQRMAAEVGYSETAFLVPGAAEGDYTVRFFAPAAEVPFCGHATVASGVLLAELVGTGTYRFATPAGTVAVAVDRRADGLAQATLTSVPPTVGPPPPGTLEEALAACGWGPDVLDPDLTPVVADAGARHLLFAVDGRDRLAALRYDFPRLAALMAAQEWTTVAVLWREHATRYHARNAFPPGGVVEDPATGAAAAALGAALRAAGHVTPPVTLTVVQGVDLGRPSHLVVHVPPGDGGIEVTGTAVPIAADG